MIAAFEMRACCLEVRTALLVHEPRRRIAEPARGRAFSWHPFGFGKQRPAIAEPPQDVVQSCRDADQLGLGRAVEIGTAIADRPLETAVLVQHDSGRHQTRPRDIVRKPRFLAAVFGKTQHASAPL